MNFVVRTPLRLNLENPEQAEIYQVMKNPNLKLEEIKKLKEALVRMESVIQRDNREPWDKHDCA